MARHAAGERADRRRWRALDEVVQRRAADFVGLTVTAARDLAAELGLEIGVVRPGEWVTQEYQLGRVRCYADDDTITACVPG